MAQPSTWTAVRSADDVACRRGSVAAPNLADVLERVLDRGMIIAAGMRHERRHSGSVAMNGHVERATYTYAIARPFHPSHLWGVRGVDRTAVHLVHHGELVAVVGTLPFTEADEAALRARLETPAELEAIAGPITPSSTRSSSTASRCRSGWRRSTGANNGWSRCCVPATSGSAAHSLGSTAASRSASRSTATVVVVGVVAGVGAESATRWLGCPSTTGTTVRRTPACPA